MTNKLCCLCGIRPATTKDHIPPKCIFPSPRPVDIITVPACEECNEGTSAIDEEFRVFVSMFAGKRTAEAERLWENQTLSTVKKNRRLLDKATSACQPGYITSKHGIILGTVDLVVWDDSMSQIIDKMIRGLYFYHFGQILADRVDITVKQVNILTMNDIERNNLRECLKPLPCNYVADGQFLYRYARANDNPLRSVWFFIFHSSLMVMGHTSSK